MKHYIWFSEIFIKLFPRYWSAGFYLYGKNRVKGLEGAASRNFQTIGLKFTGLVLNRLINRYANFQIILTYGSGFINEIPRIFGENTQNGPKYLILKLQPIQER